MIFFKSISKKMKNSKFNGIENHSGNSNQTQKKTKYSGIEKQTHNMSKHLVVLCEL